MSGDAAVSILANRAQCVDSPYGTFRDFLMKDVWRDVCDRRNIGRSLVFFQRPLFLCTIDLSQIVDAGDTWTRTAAIAAYGPIKMHRSHDPSSRKQQTKKNRRPDLPRTANFVFDHGALFSASGGAGIAFSERKINPSPPKSSTSITNVLKSVVG